MANKIYPDVRWPVFACCNADQTTEFENMTRRLFCVHFAGGQLLHSDSMNPGVEVLPVLEPLRDDGLHRRRISFQSKYLKDVNYSEIQKSAKKTVKYYKGKLDLVYLFCNQTLTTTAKGYQKAAQILAAENIDLIPISNEELLDLIVQYPEIANYYFQRRTIPSFTEEYAPNLTIITTSNESTRPQASSHLPVDNSLLQDLITEKVRSFRDSIHSLKLDGLQQELDSLLDHSLDGINGTDELRFYHYLLRLRDGEEPTPLRSDNPYYRDACWARAIYDDPSSMEMDKFSVHGSEAQIVVIEKLFKERQWEKIVSLYEMNNAAECIRTQFELHYGLSLFNLQVFDRSSQVLHNLCEKTSNRTHKMFATFADIQKANSYYRKGLRGDAEGLSSLLQLLDTFKDIKQYQDSELLVSALRMESLYNLGIEHREYIDQAIFEFPSYSEEVRKNTVLQYYYGLCIGLNNSRSDAADIFEKLDWRSDDAIAAQYMMSLALGGRAAEACDAYKSLDQSALTARTLGVYFFCLCSNHSSSYYDELKKGLDKYSNSLPELVQIASYIEDRNAGRSIALPLLKSAVAKDGYSSLPFYQQIELLLFLASNGEITLAESILQSVDDLNQINATMVGELYRILFQLCTTPSTFSGQFFQTSVEAIAIEHIADMFLAAEISRKNFLQIKVICVSSKKIPFSTLKYSKELFEITHDESTARNIIALLLERGERNFAEYEPYIDVLKHSENPEHCMAVASAFLFSGKEDIAESYAYKGMYLLNGVDNFEIYRLYFGLSMYKLHSSIDHDVLHSARGNSVVTLECLDSEAVPVSRKVVCLDSESEYTFSGNMSMGIAHLCSSDLDYLKVTSAGKGQVIRVFGGRFKVVDIIPRSQQCMGFVFGKMRDHSDQFPGSYISVSSDDPNEMIAQLKSLTDRSEEIQSLLKAYHFESCETGLPIELIGFCDYDRYLAAFRHLLYGPDQAFYAGEYIYVDETGQKYVPTLSTFVLLCLLERMDLLEAIKEDIIIPSSYKSFFSKRLEKALNDQATDAKTLFFNDGQPVLQGPDTTAAEIWETIFNFCNNCESVDISDQDRIDFEISSGFSGEQFITGLRLNVIQLDALALAKNTGATYLSDDLFFRKVAVWAGIRHLNLASILLHCNDVEFRASVINELSKTNYLYIPLIANSDEEFQTLYNNLLAEGRKGAYNSDWIRRNHIAREQVIRQLLGDDYVDGILEELKSQKMISTPDSTTDPQAT